MAGYDQNTAFFRFDTNVGIVANDIVSNMERVNAALSKPLPAPNLVPYTDALRPVTAALETEAQRARAKIQDLMNSLASGKINPGQFKAQWETLFRETITEGVPRQMAQAIGNMQFGQATTGQWRTYSTEIARGLAGALNQAFKEASAGIDLKNLLGDTKLNNLLATNAVKTVGANPVAYGTESTPLARLRNQAIAESFAEKNPYGKNATLNALEKELGLRERIDELRRVVPKEEQSPFGGYMKLVKNAEGKEEKKFVPTLNLGAQIGAEETVMRQMAATAERINVATDRRRTAEERAAAALQLEADAWRQIDRSHFINRNTGEIMRRTGDGARLLQGAEVTTTDSYALREQATINAKRAEYRRMLEAEQLAQRLLTDPNAVPVRGATGYRVTGEGDDRRVYKLNAERTAAEEITRESGEYAEVLAKQDAELAKILAKEQERARIHSVMGGNFREVSAGTYVGLDSQRVLKATADGYREVAKNTDAARTAIARLGVLQKQEANAAMLAADPSLRRGPSGFSQYRVIGENIPGGPDNRRVFTYDAINERARELNRLSLIHVELLKAEDALTQKLAADEVKRAMAVAEVANKEMEAARAAAIRDAQHNSGIVGGAIARMNRNDSSFMTNMGVQMMSAATYSFAYGALFGLGAVMRDTLKEFLDYQDSLTDLEVATKSADAVTNKWMNSLSNMSRLAGANMGQAADSAARGIRAFADVNANNADKQQIGSAVNEAATKLALIAEKDQKDATGDIVAIGTAFNLQADQLNQIVDAVANAKRNVGGDASQISQGLSLIALSAQEAGYSLNEAAAVIGLVQARTDQSGQAIATRLTRIFQITQGSTGKRLGGELFGASGYDLQSTPKVERVTTDSTVKEQLQAYADIYANPNTTEGTRDRIVSSLGGTANMRELLPLLKEGSRLQDAFRQALINAGQGADEFGRKSDNLVGTLKKIKGDLSNIQVQFAKSGFLDIFAGAFMVLEPILHTLDKMLQTINEMPTPLKHLVGIMTDLALAAKAVSLVQGKNLLFAGGATAAGTAAAESAAREVAIRAAEDAAALRFANAAQIAAVNGDTAARLRAEAAMNAVIVSSAERRAAAEGVGAGSSMLGGLKSMAGWVKANPVLVGATAAIGTLAFLFGKFSDAQEKFGTLQQGAGSSMKTYDRANDSTGLLSVALSRSAQDQRSLAGNIKKSEVGWDIWGFGQRKEELAEEAKNRARSLTYLSKKVAEEERLSSQYKSNTLVTSGLVATTEQLANGLARMQEAGAGAVSQWKALLDTIMTPPPPPGTQRWKPENTKANIFDALAGSLGSAIKEEDPNFSNLQATARGGATDYTKVLKPSEIAAKIIGDRENLAKEMDQALSDQIKSAGLENADFLTDEQIKSLVTKAADVVDLGKYFGADAARVRKEWIKQALFTLGDVNGTNGVPTDLLNGSNLSTQQINELLYGRPGEGGKPDWIGSVQSFDTSLATIPGSDDGTKKAAYMLKQLEFYRYVKRNADPGADLENIQVEIDKLKHDWKEVTIDQIDQLRLAAEAGAKSDSELQRIRQKYANMEFRKAGRDKSKLKELMSSMDRKTTEAYVAYLESSIAVMNNAIANAEAQFALVKFGTMTTAAIADYVITTTESNQEKIDKLTGVLDAIRDLIPSIVFSGDSATLGGGSGESAAEKQANLIEAQAQARAARIGGQLASARAALTGAKAQLGVQKKGTAEYYQALASYYEAQWQLKDAIEAYNANLRTLRGDATNPVEQARDALRNARERFRNAISKDDKAAARVELESSEAALEKAKWDQKLSDMQIAEQLGRISSATYIRYLERERDRMQKIHNRTRQQTDYLNQLEIELKNVSQAMSGMFNIGDIDTRGFIYQVRRMASGADMTSPTATSLQSATAVTTNNVTINGTDITMVRRVLKEMLGTDSPTTTTTTRKIS